ncbi:MAG: hypothetical protein FJY10_07455 [Bacteroidetes bacterium]|nr:hypothetical protein [Bacteroidota bacterium]
MKHRTIIAFCVLVTLLVIHSSCKTTYPQAKIIPGKWKSEKVEILPNPDATLPREADRMIEYEKRATLELLEGGTAYKHFGTNSIQGKWKLKGKGTKLIATDEKSGKVMTYFIIKLSDNEAVIEQRYPFGKIKVTYIRITE